MIYIVLVKRINEMNETLLHLPGQATGLCLSPERYSLITGWPVAFSSLARSFSFDTSTTASLTFDPLSSAAAPWKAVDTRWLSPDRGATDRHAEEMRI